MKKLSIFALVLVMALSLAACGGSGRNETGAPTTDTNILPDIAPSMGTNIPDPSVNTSMPPYTQDHNTTGNTSGAEGTDSTGGTQGGVNRGY